MKRTIAVKYFKNKKLTIDQSVELAEISEENFIKYSGRFNISIFRYDDLNELKEDANNA